MTDEKKDLTGEKLEQALDDYFAKDSISATELRQAIDARVVSFVHAVMFPLTMGPDFSAAFEQNARDVLKPGEELPAEIRREARDGFSRAMNDLASSPIERTVEFNGKRYRQVSDDGGKTAPSKLNIALDFDGVVHTHVSKWTDAHEIIDGPVAGAFEFIRTTLDGGFGITIHTARARTVTTVPHVYAWLRKHGLEEKYVWQIDITALKPAAHVYIDDAAWRFEGRWPSLDEIRALRAWNKSPTGATPFAPTVERRRRGATSMKLWLWLVDVLDGPTAGTSAVVRAEKVDEAREYMQLGRDVIANIRELPVDATRGVVIMDEVKRERDDRRPQDWHHVSNSASLIPDCMRAKGLVDVIKSGMHVSTDWARVTCAECLAIKPKPATSGPQLICADPDAPKRIYVCESDWTDDVVRKRSWSR